MRNILGALILLLVALLCYELSVVYKAKEAAYTLYTVLTLIAGCASGLLISRTVRK